MSQSIESFSRGPQLGSGSPEGALPGAAAGAAGLGAPAVLPPQLPPPFADSAPDLGPLLDAFIFSAADKRSARPAGHAAERVASAGSPALFSDALDVDAARPEEVPEDEARGARGQADSPGVEYGALGESFDQTGMPPTAFEPDSPREEDSSEAVRSSEARAPNSAATEQANAARTADAATRAETNRDFWAEVVDVHEALLRHGGLPPNEALNSAIAWVTLSALVPEASKVNVAAPNGLPRALPGSPARSLTAPASVGPALRGAADVARWVSDLRADLSGQATRALIAAWEQRGSALRAASGAKG